MNQNGSGAHEEQHEPEPRIKTVPPMVEAMRREATRQRCVMFKVCDENDERKNVRADGYRFYEGVDLMAVGYPAGWTYQGRYRVLLAQASKRLALARLIEEVNGL